MAAFRSGIESRKERERERERERGICQLSKILASARDTQNRVHGIQTPRDAAAYSKYDDTARQGKARRSTSDHLS